MSRLEDLAGRCYGPVEFRISSGRVSEYVAATGDDPERWRGYAPPSFAGAVLFEVAPAFFADPDVASHSRLLIHGEQVFTWKAPWLIGSRHSVEAGIGRLRRRGDTAFVTFVVTVRDHREREVLSSRSLFLMSDSAPPGGRSVERPEPEPEARRANLPSVGEVLPATGRSLMPVPKSASRADLVRYAGASGDFNPVHWDHGRAVDSGVGGVICHGLLMAAWATQPAALSVPRVDPLAKGRFRFRRPLYPNTAAHVTTTVRDRSDGRARLDAKVTSDGRPHVVASLEVRTG